MTGKQDIADICLLAEGTYPYVAGGVSTWTHNLITSLPEFTFSIVCILPQDERPALKYEIPSNVISVSHIGLQEIQSGKAKLRDSSQLFAELKPLLLAMHSGQGAMNDMAGVIEALRRYPGVGGKVLLNSEEAWNMLLEMYHEQLPESSFIDYFWSWRALLGGLYSMLLAELPPARLYHAISTGYAGLLAARATLELRKPSLLTEHGIYTNERRIEINAADWLSDDAPQNLAMERNWRDLRALWMDSFTSYSRICYQASQRIVTLFTGNQQAQLEDGAQPDKMLVIPNGIDVERYTLDSKAKSRPTIALIGRVVPIKDIKTFIRACDIIRQRIPDLLALVLGPTDEDNFYYEECLELVEHLSLQDVVSFAGQVDLREYLPEIDLVVLTSISEAQPLVILEAGAAGVPSVATNVGACHEIIMGAEDEMPKLGAGGAVTGLASPVETAGAVIRLLLDRKAYTQAARAIRERVAAYYRKERQITSYRNLYRDLMETQVKEEAA